eukprot:CAMPEP_0115069232 /NCGR_PEP_ID=MMETSP0227-20121206/12445_1 /TAXON_ID=89957 /ORGANISM="Polarella glacialis, Strain CCMP 1383" /LENGTH=64 /DNA_ID=CAMNT_0002455615 /DNA_START=357 /DNA_END=551 /DNA_ORIENTATION=+
MSSGILGPGAVALGRHSCLLGLRHLEQELRAAEDVHHLVVQLVLCGKQALDARDVDAIAEVQQQ